MTSMGQRGTKLINTKLIFLPSGIEYLSQKSERKRSVEVSNHLTGTELEILLKFQRGLYLK